MHIITIKNMKEDGAYAVINEFGEKVVFMFQSKPESREISWDHSSWAPPYKNVKEPKIP